MDTKILSQIGLNESEIRVYFALLELEESSVGPIIERAKVQDSKIYVILSKLIEKGLASFIVKNNVKYYLASDPSNLIEFINEKEKQLSQQKEEIKKLLPDIEARRKKANELQKATVYESLEGVKAAFTNILNNLKKGEEYYVFTLGKELEEKSLITFFNNYHKKRIEKGIKVKLIVNSSIKENFTKEHMYKGMEARYTKLVLPSGIFIYGNNVMTFVWSENPTAFVITSKTNAEKYLSFFNEVWKGAKK